MSPDAIAPHETAADDPAIRPSIALLAGRHRHAEGGHRWIHSNEIVMDAAAKALAPGSLVTLRRADGSLLGVGMFNPHTLLAARLLDRDTARPIGRRFLARGIGRALKLRERLFDQPYYRLVQVHPSQPLCLYRSGDRHPLGPPHGGANEAVLQTLAGIGSVDRIPEILRRAKDKNDPFRLMGFGHRVYKSYNPRAKMCAGAPMMELGRVTLEDDYFHRAQALSRCRLLFGIIFRALGLPPAMFGPSAGSRTGTR
jgi:hypothetical protein